LRHLESVCCLEDIISITRRGGEGRFTRRRIDLAYGRREEVWDHYFSMRWKCMALTRD